MESSPGKGSHFWFELDFEIAEEAPSEADFAKDFAGKRVLVVDDNETSRELLIELLSSWGVSVETARDGKGALASFAEAERSGKDFDMVLVDMNMPGMDGLQLAERLRSEVTAHGAKVLMLTSVVDTGKFTGKPANLDACLAKPIRPSELLETMIRLMGGEVEDGRRAVAKDRPALGLRVLAAEDNPANQEVLEAALEALGYDFKVVADGKAAVKALEHDHDFAAVLMDCAMPVMDGYAASREIRTLEEKHGTPRIPIIAVTAHALADDREKVLAAGMDDYITKPVRFDDLRRTLDDWCQVIPDSGPPRTSRDSSNGGAHSVPVLDHDTVDELKSLQTAKRPHFVRNLVDTYLSDTRTKVQSLKTASENGRAADAKSLAHSLFGASRNVGACRLSERFAELKGLAQEGKLDESAVVLEAIAQDFLVAEQALRKVVEESESS